jgi:hypothetical protein
MDNGNSITRRGSKGIFLFATTSIPVLGPTQSIIQWVLGAHSPGVKTRVMKPISYLRLVARLRMRRAIIPFPDTSSWRGAWKAQGQLYLYFYCISISAYVSKETINERIIKQRQCKNLNKSSPGRRVFP